MSEHICNPTIPVCSCGKRWERVTTYDDGTRLYGSEEEYHRYKALYGDPLVPMERT